MIPDIPHVGGENIPFIQVNGTGVKLIQTIRPSNIGVRNIADVRVFMNNAPTVIPPTVPVTEVIGTPIVNMPGCVKVQRRTQKIQRIEIRCWWMMILKAIQYCVMLVLPIMNQPIMIIED